MGGFSAQVQNGQTGQPSSKGSPVSNPAPKPLDGIENGYFAQAPRPMGKGGAQTNSATSGQPTMGAPNKYPNTVGQWDNSGNKGVQNSFGGKGKGASSSAPSGDSMGYGGSNSLIENTYHPELANKPYNPQ